MVSENQYKGVLDGSVPVLVQPVSSKTNLWNYQIPHLDKVDLLKLRTIFQVNWMETAEEIDDLFIGDAEVFSIPYNKLWKFH